MNSNLMTTLISKASYQPLSVDFEIPGQECPFVSLLTEIHVKCLFWSASYSAWWTLFTSVNASPLLVFTLYPSHQNESMFHLILKLTIV